MHIKGLLEMMFDKLGWWIDEFIVDMEVRPFSPQNYDSYSCLLKSEPMRLSPACIRLKQNAAHGNFNLSYPSDSLWPAEC